MTGKPMMLETVHAASSPLTELLKSDAMKDALLRAAAKLEAQAAAAEPPVPTPALAPEPSTAPQESARHQNEEDKDETDGCYKPNPNPAVERCIQAYNRAHTERETAGRNHRSCIEAAENAFRLAIPPLDSPESVPNFIACVTRGMLNGSIPTKDASRYLYAAQVAQTASLESKSGPRPGRPSGRTPYPPGPYPYPETTQKPVTNS